MQAGSRKDPLYKFVQFEKYQKKEYLELPEEKGGTPFNVSIRKCRHAFNVYKVLPSSLKWRVTFSSARPALLKYRE